MSDGLDYPKEITFEGPVIDWDDDTQEWVCRCPYHGEVFRLPGTAGDHDRTVINAARHWQNQDGGDGLVDVDMLITP